MSKPQPETSYVDILICAQINRTPGAVPVRCTDCGLDLMRDPGAEPGVVCVCTACGMSRIRACLSGGGAVDFNGRGAR